MAIDFKTFKHDQRQQIIDSLDLDQKLKNECLSYQSSIEVVNDLVHQTMQTSAIQFMAYGLPKRQAAWWGFLVAKDFKHEHSDSNVENALKVSEQWIRSPSEELRQQAKHLADALDLYTPASWLAQTIFLSGDNIAPAGKPSVTPSEFMPGSSLFNCIESALEPLNQDQQIQMSNHYLKQAMHIAMGGNGIIY